MPVLTEPASSFINGAWIESAGTITYRFNPAAPSEAVTAYRQAGSEDLAKAIQAATMAAPAWDRLGNSGQRSCLVDCGPDDP